MAEVTRSNPGTTVYITTSPANQLKVEHLLSLADRLRTENAPLDVRVNCTHDWNTHHLTGLNIRYTEPNRTETP